MHPQHGQLCGDALDEEQRGGFAELGRHARFQPANGAAAAIHVDNVCRGRGGFSEFGEHARGLVPAVVGEPASALAPDFVVGHRRSIIGCGADILVGNACVLRLRGTSARLA